MKLGELQTFNVKKGLVIKAKAETKKNLPQKKEVDKEIVYKDVIEEKVINLTDNSYLVVSTSCIEGEEDVYVDIRLFKKTDKYNGPTTKGIRVHVEFLEDILNALHEVDEELDSLGV